MERMIRGRVVTDQDVELIRSLLVQQGHRGRCSVAGELCRQWDWRRPDGELKLRACQDVLTRLEAQGHFTLPLRRSGSTSPRQKWRQRSQQMELFAKRDQNGLVAAESVWGQIQWRLVLSGPDDELYKDLVHTHHYLGYRPGIGHSLRYMAFVQGHAIACVGWSAAAWRVAVRDQWIGWSEAARQRNLRQVVNNTRFLVLERIPHLASHLLAANVRCLKKDWPRQYGYSPVLLETFVDMTRFSGTCYKAANWTSVGLTQGRGKYDRHTQYPETIKAVFVYPLVKTFREVLCHG